MERNDEVRAANREAAGRMLAQRLVESRPSNGIVVGVPRGGVMVAAAMAERLQLPLETLSCRPVPNPSDSTNNIGSVTAEEVYLHDRPETISEDSLYLKTVALRNQIKYEEEFYHGANNPVSYEGKMVIVTDDILTSPDALMACLIEIRKQVPAKLIVAVPLVAAEAARMIQSACDELIFLKMKQQIESPAELYDDFPRVDEWMVRDVFRRLRPDLVEKH